MGTILLTLLLLVGLFLMFVVLLQRGRGGGLAGAFGGLGGQSAFGTKAGDVFTTITIVTTIVWVVLACITGWRLQVEDHAYYADKEGAKKTAPADDKAGKDKADVTAPGDKADETGAESTKTVPAKTEPKTGSGKPSAAGKTKSPPNKAAVEVLPASPPAKEASEKPAAQEPAPKEKAATEEKAGAAGDAAPKEAADKPPADKPADSPAKKSSPTPK